VWSFFLPDLKGSPNHNGLHKRNDTKSRPLAKSVFARLVLSLNTLLTLDRVGSNLLVITLKGGKVLTGLGELALLHTLTDVPVDEGTLGVHEIELVRESRPSLGDGGGVGKHAARLIVSKKQINVIHVEFNLHSAVDLGEIAVGHVLRRLVADTDLETSRAPVDELDGALGLEGSDSAVDVLGDNITTVEQAGGHVLAVAGVTLDHLVVGLEARHGDLLDRVGLVGRLGGRDNGGVGDQREVDTGVGDQVGLELVQVDVEGTVEAKRGSDGRDD
jgi:hypothetical protein